MGQRERDPPRDASDVWAYDPRDPSELDEHMIVAIALGATEAEGERRGLIVTEEDRETWRRYAESIAEIHAQGHGVVFTVEGWDDWWRERD